MTYRDDLEAATNRAEALDDELESTKAENDRLRAELEAAKAAKAAPAAKPPKPKARSSSTPDGFAPRDDLDGSYSETMFENATSKIATDRVWFVAVLVPLFMLVLWFAGFGNTTGGVICGIGCGVVLLVIVWSFIKPIFTAKLFRAWFAGLPFQTAGFFGMFDTTHDAVDDGQFRIFVWFAGKHPTIDEVLALDDTITGGLADDGRPILVLDMQVPHDREGDRFTARNVLVASRDIIESVLLPLHARFPITRVEFRE